jgi:hypothetical protein
VGTLVGTNFFEVARAADAVVATLEVTFAVTFAVTLALSVTALPRRNVIPVVEWSTFTVCVTRALACEDEWTDELADTGEIDDQSNAPLNGTASEPTRTTRRIWRALIGAVATRRTLVAQFLNPLFDVNPCVVFMPSSLEKQNQSGLYVISTSTQLWASKFLVLILWVTRTNGTISVLTSLFAPHHHRARKCVRDKR